MAVETLNKKVSLSFTSKSKKVSSALNLRQQSIQTHRDEDSTSAHNVTNNINDLFTKKHKEVIIPLIKHNQWRKSSAKPPPLESEDTDAMQTDDLTKQQQEALDLILNHNPISNTSAPIIPLAPNSQNGAFNQMEMNKVPGIEDVRDAKKKLEIDCAQRPREPDADEYNAMPIASFGVALLKGMGWNKDKPIGNQYGQNNLIVPTTTVIKPRPKNLGLGATLTKEEADMIVKRKYNPNKQRTKTDKKRIAEIQSWTKTKNEPPKKKQKVSHSTKEIKKKRHKIRWIKNGLRVRCVKENGYFREKGVVIDVMDEYRVSVKMNKDSKLMTLYEDEVDTVIPGKGHFVMILRGVNKNERGSILTKNKHKQCASVQLEHNLSIVNCDYDDICAI
eukprot:31527_1